MLTILVVALGLTMCWAGVSQAAPMGTAFTYQGRLLDANSAADGLYDFQFKLYDANTAGNQLDSDVNMPDVDVIDGYFTVELDFGGGVFDGNAVWLDIGVRPGDMNDPNVYTTLSPRQEVTPTPYAIYAQNSAGLTLPYAGSVASGNVAFWIRNTGTAQGIIGHADQHDGIVGSSNAFGKSGVFGFNDTAGGIGIFGSSNDGIGVQGHTHGTGRAGFFEIVNPANNNNALEATTNGGGSAVHGSNGSNYGYLGTSSYGVYGYAAGTSGFGLYGRAAGNGGVGAYGYASNTGDTTNYGGYFTAAGSYGRGVYGRAINSGNITNYGGYFTAAGSTGRGIYGYASNTGDVYNYGGYFTAAGTYGRGVFGYASNSGDGLNTGGYFKANGTVAYGVEGYAPGTSGIGVYGHSTNKGVYGYSTGNNGHGVEGNVTGDNSYGVYGRASGIGSKAGYFSGDVHTTGQITKAYTVGTSNSAVPIAYAFINAAATVASGTPNASCIWNPTYSRYEITISGESYFYNDYVTVVTPSGGAYIATTSSVSGKLIVYIYNLSGTKIQADFQFITYKP